MSEEIESLREIWDENPDTRMTCGAGRSSSARWPSSAASSHCWNIAPHLSEPQIIVRGKPNAQGERPIIDDFREAYWWLRDETPPDAA